MTDTAFGNWSSPITPELVTAASVSLAGPVADGGWLYWSELRPDEGGRVQIVRKRLDEPPGSGVDLLPEGWSARTRVHEYGGGSFWVSDGLVVFARWHDQRLWALRPDTVEADPWPLTPVPEVEAGDRYADMRMVPGGQTVLAVREHHAAEPPAGEEPAEARNEIVAIRVVEPGAEPVEPVVMVTGPHFVSHPRLAPDGHSFCWLQWNHPDMPWDQTQLGVARLSPAGDPLTEGPLLEDVRIAAGAGGGESITQPEWDETGHLWFVSDRLGVTEDGDGWWGLWRFEEAGAPGVGAEPEPVVVSQGSELAQPQWVFGQSWYCFVGDDLVYCHRRDGRDHLMVSSGPVGSLDHRSVLDAHESLLDGVTAIDGLCSTGRGVALIAARFDREAAIQEVVLDRSAPAISTHRRARDLGLDRSWWSRPDHVSVPIPGEDAEVHALVYPPTNPEVDRDGVHVESGTPPLLVTIHGGPTSAARPLLQLGVQYWTTRGFCVAAVNYRGSTGYGRRYRRALDGCWGVADVVDCLAVARHLAAVGRVDPDRCAIRGGSAGGFTVLNALIDGDAFSVGACLYGVTDLEALAQETHKFESRYLDSLIGPYPDRADLYRQRSPINHLEDLTTPVIVFQGLEDEVVPPSQAEELVEALRANGVLHEYLAFEGEQHGFRRAETIQRVLIAELYFYQRVFGILGGDR